MMAFQSCFTGGELTVSPMPCAESKKQDCVSSLEYLKKGGLGRWLSGEEH